MKCSPMLTKIGNKSDLSKKGYLFEPKVDGIRAICYKNKKIKLINRKNKDITYQYPEFNFIKQIHTKSCVLDGEIIVYDKKGKPNFNLLQKRQLEKPLLIKTRCKEYPATYVVFDILMKNGKSLVHLPLNERKKILDKTITDNNQIQKIYFTKNGKKLWKEIIKKGLEGVVAKDETSKYSCGTRSSIWLKIKDLKTIDCIILGFTQGKRIISSLALGVYAKGKLKYIGSVGTGFSFNFLKDLHKTLLKLKVKKPPVEYVGTKKINWVKPKLVCEIKYLEITKDDKLRTPVFLWMREDKKPKECTLETQK